MTVSYSHANVTDDCELLCERFLAENLNMEFYLNLNLNFRNLNFEIN